jgi:Protein of unknown function (DUF1552)
MTSRRRFLAGLGAGALLTPFIPILNTSAQESTAPRRVIFLFSANGTIHDAWKPGSGGEELQFGEILAPLEPFADKITVLDGLRYATGGSGNNHMAGPHRFMAGSGLLAGNEFTGGGDASSGWGSHISVDQHIAAAVGQDTAYASLEFGVQNGGANPRSRMVYAGENQPIAPEDNPYDMFDRLFSDFGQSEAELDRIRKERQSVIDVVSEQLDGLAPKYASADKLKMEAHLEAIRAIEKRLDIGYGAGCSLPTVGDQVDHQADDSFQHVSELQIDLMVMAMACDLTRTSSLMWSRATSQQSFPFLGFTDRHHDLSHEGDSNGDAQGKLRAINNFYASQLAYLLTKLAEVPEGEGTMLDNTLIVWGNELGKGNSHSRHPIPLVLAGGAADYFRMGRSLDYGDEIHNRLLVSICHYMGLTEQQSFGNNDDGSGPLPDLV